MVRIMIGAFRVTFLFFEYAMIINPTPTVKRKKKATCKRTINELPELNTKAKIIIAKTSLITRTV